MTIANIGNGQIDFAFGVHCGIYKSKIELYKDNRTVSFGNLININQNIFINKNLNENLFIQSELGFFKKGGVIKFNYYGPDSVSDFKNSSEIAPAFKYFTFNTQFGFKKNFESASFFASLGPRIDFSRNDNILLRKIVSGLNSSVGINYSFNKWCLQFIFTKYSNFIKISDCIINSNYEFSIKDRMISLKLGVMRVF